MDNVVIFGGSFDPVHQGHLQIINQMLKSLKDISYFYIVPSGIHPEGKSFLFSTQQRVFMLKACLGLLTEKEKNAYKELENISLDIIHPSIRISMVEIEQTIPSFMINTIKIFKKQHPNCKLHLIIGGDQAEKFSSWYQATNIANMVELWVFPRENKTPDPKFSWNILDVHLEHISSTIIREKILQKDSLLDKKIPLVLQKIIPNLILHDKQ